MILATYRKLVPTAACGSKRTFRKCSFDGILVIGSRFLVSLTAPAQSPAVRSGHRLGGAEMLLQAVFLLSLVTGFLPVTSPLAADAQARLLPADIVIE